MTIAKTCGPLYFASRTLTGHDADIKPFAAGFATGLCEKVYLGACFGAMLRPAREDFDWLLATVKVVVRVYDLTVNEYRYPENGPRAGSREIWILNDNPVAGYTYRQMIKMTVNTPGWHTARGQLCGIPSDQIDYAFHERQAAT